LRPVAVDDAAVRLAGSINAATVQHFVTRTAFDGAHVVERVGTKLRFSVPLEGRTLSAAFEIVEVAARRSEVGAAAPAGRHVCADLIEAYSIAQMGLEQIFNDMAAAAELEGDAGATVAAGAVPAGAVPVAAATVALAAPA